MKRRIRTILFLWGAGTSVFAPASNVPITLEDAKRFAVEHNFEVASLRNALEQAKAQQRRKSAAFYPQLGVQGGADTELKSGNQETVGVGVGYLQWNLFRGLGDISQWDAAREQTEIAKIRVQKAEFRVGVDVEAAFHKYLLQKTLIGIQKKSLELNQKHKQMAVARRKSGLVSDADVMDFDITESLLDSELVSLQQQLEISRIELRRLLGEQVGQSVEPVGVLQHQHLEGSLMSYLDRIKDENEEVLALTRVVKQSELEIRSATAQFLPRVDVQVRAGYEPIRERPTNGGASVSGQVLATLDLFSGFDTANARAEKTAELLRNEARLKQTILDALSTTEKVYRQIRAIQERVDLEEKNEERALRFYRSVLSEYNRGVKNSSDVKAAANMYTDTLLRKERFKYDFLAEKLNLERVLGGPAKTTLED